MTAGPDFDAIVIGSGFGGAVTACRLAQAGRRVVVLERGRRWVDREFPRTMSEVGRAFWDDERAVAQPDGRGFLEYLAFRRVDVIQGVGVGGGSLHYFNVNLKPPAQIFERPEWPAEITSETLEPYFEKALAMLESAPLEVPDGESGLPPRMTIFTEAARTAGYQPEAVPIAVHVGPDRTHPVSGVEQQACNYCGNCLFGCDRNAKQTLDHNYLALAELLGTQVLPLHEATRISRLEDGGYEVQCRQLDADGGPESTSVFRSASVIVSAGSLGSTQLLLRCRDVHRSLPDLPQSLGQSFSVNGEFLLARGQGSRTPVEAGVGPPITAMVMKSVGDNDIISVQDLGLPDQLLWYLEGAIPPARRRMVRLVKLAAHYLGRTFGIGAASRLSIRLEGLVAGARFSEAMPYLGMGTDAGGGQMRLVRGRLSIDWKAGRSKKIYQEIEKVMAEISEAAGGKFVTSPLWRWPFRKVLTAHPLGGCAMSDNPESGVVDHRGQVWGHDGLFVVDGSIIPGALAVNPSLTITALAERAAFWAVHGRDIADNETTEPAR